MALFDGIKRQLRSVIAWQDPAPNVLFEQWTDNGDEIKNASKLIVGPGQGCVFVYQGQVQAVIEEECLVTLATANIPFWTTIKKFMQFFESEHKVGIYFFRRTQILNQKWGTKAPIKYLDPHYRFPVGLKAFGNYSYQITDPRGFFVNVVGGQSRYAIEDLRSVMTERLLQPLSDFLAENRFSYNDIDANREEIAQGVFERLNRDFAALGFRLSDFRIEGTDFDDDTQRRINRIADMTAEMQAAQAVGLDYASVQQLAALRDAARNEGGAAGAGVGLGAGISLGQTLAQHLTPSATPQTAAPEAASPPANDPATLLTQLKQLHEAGLISEEEYAAKRRAVLDRL